MRLIAAYVVTAALLVLLPPLPAHADGVPIPQRCSAGSGMYDVAVPGAPMSAVATPDEQTVFVSLNSTEPRQLNGIAVLRCTEGRYRLERIIPLESQPTIAALTHDGKMLVVPDDSFIAFVDVKRALSGGGDPISGFIEDVPGDNGGAIYAAISPDDRFAFVAEEQSGKLTVIDMQKARAGGAIAHDDIVSEFLIGNAPIALIFSKDGHYLFATVQIALKRYGYAQTCEPETASATPREAPGAIVTIDVAKAASDPDHSIVSNVPAGCHPVRAALSPDGSTLWVTARKSNAVLRVLYQ
jgi:DNA-binding beta-propeller fold protein YncE